jgi:hypothetical protein
VVGWTPKVEQSVPGPVCQGKYLDPLTVCIACDRSGKDGSIPRLTRAAKAAMEAAAKAVKPAASANGQLAGGRGRLPDEPAGGRCPARGARTAAAGSRARARGR